MWKLLMTRKIHAHIHTQRMASHIQRRNWRDGKSEWQASSNGEFWAKVQKFLDNQLFFFLSSSSPNYLLISSSIEYQLLCHGRPRRRSVSVWWDTARAKNGSSKNQFGIEYSMKLFSPALIQKTWDSRRRLNCQLAIQWPASTNSTNLQSRPDRRCGVYKRLPLVCWSVKESPDGEDCDVVPLTSQ